jgi:hypothetical protein
MKSDPFKIIDKSGDRKYFTIIPNYIVNHSTVYEQAIYLYMKRVAGETGTCWESPINIAKKLDIAPGTVRKYQKTLVQRGWIEKVGVAGKTKPTIEYKIVDLWQLNAKYYAKKEKSPDDFSHRKGTGCVMKSHQVILEKPMDGNKEESIKKINKEDIASPSANADTPMDLKEFVEWCNQSPQRHIKIIGIWADTEEPNFTTKKQWEAFIKRNLRAAKDLMPFEDERLKQGYKRMREAVKEGWLKKYSLETLLKFIV